MTDQCMKCGKWYTSHETEQEIAIGDDAIAIICPVYCPHCGDRGVQVYRYVWDQYVDRVPYKELESIPFSYKVTNQVLKGLVAREVKEIKRLNPTIDGR